jgi:hypothetical protein
MTSVISSLNKLVDSRRGELLSREDLIYDINWSRKKETEVCMSFHQIQIHANQ